MLLFLTSFSVVTLLESQAGGGGSFGGGGGGGGGDDGGWIFEILFWLIRLAIEVPVIGVPLLVGVVVLFLLGTRKGWWKHQERVIHRNAPRIVAQRSVVPQPDLRARDPNFDEAEFLRRVAVAFEKAQAAWCAQDLEPLRGFVSDGVFERFALQIAEQRDQGWRQGMTGTQLGRLTIRSVSSGRLFDTLVVHIPFESRIERIELATGAVVPGSRLPRTHFEECWSFVRRVGTRTRRGDGLFEGTCPNCGAPVGINQSAQCGSCQALVRSGEFDWVLTEITQASEWSAEVERSVRGFDAIAERDAGLSLQMLEDRVSVAFWRWSAAQRLGRAEPLMRVADKELCDRVQAELVESAQRKRSLMLDRAVGSVRTLGLIAGGPRELAVVEVVWDGRSVEVEAQQTAANAPRGSATDARTLRRTLFVLARRAGSVTRVAETFTTSRCVHCGAHDTGGIDATCPYCAAPRIVDPSWWIVTSIVDERDPVAARLRSELAQIPPYKARPARPVAGDLLAWVISAARADGQIDVRERAAAKKLGERFGVDAQLVDALLDGHGEHELASLPRNADEARVWLRELCELALLDGTLHHRELQLLRHAAGRFAIDARDLSALLNQTRTELYREAR